MNRCSRFIALLGLVSLGLAMPPDALAHGLHGSARELTAWEFLPLGIEHMLLGWDHLLFIVGIVLLAGRMGRAAKLISLFVAGHSLTLIVATLAGWRLDATLVDVVIALSVVYVGIQGLRGQPERWTATGAVVLAFGLVHGLGLSTRLQALGLPEDGVLWRVIAFNVGVEIGQLAALTVIVAVGTLVARSLRRPPVRRLAFGSLAAAGLVAAAVLSLPSAEERRVEELRAAGLSPDAPCEVSEAEPPSLAGGKHPPKQFFHPGEAVAEEDLDHVLGDGYAIVRYHESLPDAQRQRLAGWVDGPNRGVIGAPDAEQSEPVRVVAAYRTLSCSRFDPGSVQRFTGRWLADQRAEAAG